MFTKEKNESIVIANQKTKPGQTKTIRVPIDQLPTGTVIDIPVFVKNGEEAGPVVLVQGGLHGDEINGIEIVRRLISDPSLKITNGCLIALPIINVFGFLHFSRELPDGKDVNRCFPGSKKGSLARRIANYLMEEIVSQIEFGIDLHTGGSARNNYPQTRYTKDSEESKKLASIFNAPFHFSTPLIAHSFREATHKMGIPIIVYEGGESMRFDDFAISEGVKGIFNVLREFNMIKKKKITLQNWSVHLSKRKWIRADASGMFIPSILNGKKVEKGSTLGYITSINAENNILPVTAPFSGHIICINNQAVVNLGDALFHIGY